MLSTSGAQALLTSGADVIAGLVGAMHEAQRVRDMREYPFWARLAVLWKRCSSPRPERYCAIARRLAARPKKMLRNERRQVFWLVTFL